MRCTTLLALLTGVMLYLVMGALVFRTLESSSESLKYENLLRAKKTFLHNHSCVSEHEFYKLVKTVVSAVEAGLDVSSLPANFTSRWDVASAFLFCGTIITTIGFGNLSPRTWYGQLFCVCYALVGIPMFGILLAGVGDHMGTVLRRAVAKIETLFLKHKVRPTTVRVTSAVLSILIGCLIFLAVPTVVFQKVEKWSFLESLYFVVITLTTVGFGDYVPGGGHEGGFFFKPLVWLWIVFGLAYFASILTMIGNWLRVLSKRTRAEMEELRAHATDWTQNIQNMSMDFRIPNPLEFNDPFLLQRRKWKRSQRRRIRRGAEGTLGYLDRRGSENGHLPNRWAPLSSSMSRIEDHSSLERAAVPKPRVRIVVPGGGGGTVPKVGSRLRVDPVVGIQVEGRAFPHLLARSFSLPVARSTSELDSAGVAMQGMTLSGLESPFDSRSEASSASSSFSALCGFQPYCAVSSVEEGGARAAEMNTSKEKDKLIPAEGSRIVENRRTPTPGFLPYSSTPPSRRPSFYHPVLSPSGCQLLDFFGENLAYIDESSDTLSDRDRAKPAANEEKKKRPRKPKRRSMRRQLSHKLSPLQVRRPNSDMQPPSNPPTPPPDSSLSDVPRSESHKDSKPTL
ncbi:potassium channel subfamily K member 10 isoform X2 [Thunnus thynnus]|uniref:potassium channel subfamily K member 10 isoform X2 n=1 Tax=Thunnus thynnus TaxID=8237 RepID=UPI00352748F5